MTEQSERIQVLENQLIERDAQIKSLQSLRSGNHAETTDKSGVTASEQDGFIGDRLPSSHGSRRPESSRKLRENHQTTPVKTSSQVAPSYSRQSTALSDSDSDWDRQDVRPQAHSAPARSRGKSGGNKKPVAKLGGVPREDESLLKYVSSGTPDSVINTRDAATSEGNTQHHRKSALRKHLEKMKSDNQTNQNNSLMGPSVAFSPPEQRPPDESRSCDPTPRYKDNPARLPGFSNLTVVETDKN